MSVGATARAKQTEQEQRSSGITTVTEWSSKREILPVLGVDQVSMLARNLSLGHFMDPAPDTRDDIPENSLSPALYAAAESLGLNPVNVLMLANKPQGGIGCLTMSKMAAPQLNVTGRKTGKSIFHSSDLEDVAIAGFFRNTTLHTSWNLVGFSPIPGTEGVDLFEGTKALIAFIKSMRSANKMLDGFFVEEIADFERHEQDISDQLASCDAKKRTDAFCLLTQLLVFRTCIASPVELAWTHVLCRANQTEGPLQSTFAATSAVRHGDKLVGIAQSNNLICLTSINPLQKISGGIFFSWNGRPRW